MLPIYLDYAATTPVDPRVADKMSACLGKTGHLYGNAAAAHYYGQSAQAAIETARAQVAASIGAEPSEVIWTSGATEANNLAIKGVARLYQRRGKHIVTMQTEHKAVLDVCQFLQQEGYDITYLKPLDDGCVDIDALRAALRDDTVLVSIMHVNNETGVIQPLAKIANLTAERGILLHVDAAQSIGKTALNVRDLPIDLISLNAHKVYGPKGIGALYLRKKPRVRVLPLFHGGGHEQGMRSGTLPTHQIVGMGEAFALAISEAASDLQIVKTCQERFIAGLKKHARVHFNTARNDTVVPHILNVRFEGLSAQTILDNLPQLAATTASACQGKNNGGSYVLRAMGFTEAEIKSAIRFSFGRFTTLTEIDAALQCMECLAE